MEIPVSFMVERLKRLPSKCFIVEDGSKVYAAVKDELVIFTGKPGEFNKMTEHELATFIRKNANKKGTPVEEEQSLYLLGDWFVDVQGGEEQIWELKEEPGRGYSMWTAVIFPGNWKPSGRRVEPPEQSEWKTGNKEKVDESPVPEGITPSQAADFILDDSKWGPGDDWEVKDGEKSSDSDG